MPIFARKKLVLHDDCLQPYKKIHLTYEGPNPHLAYPFLKNLISEVFGVPKEEIQEVKFDWSRGGKKESFNIEWEFAKDLDKLSYMLVNIKIKGEVWPSEKFGKEGKIKVDIAGVIRTEYPQDTWIERSVFYEVLRMLWHKFFYTEQRYKYVEECKHQLIAFHDRLKDFLNALPHRS